MLEERQAMPQSAVIALDLGGTKLASCLCVDGGQLQAQQIVPLDLREGREVGQLISEQIRRLLQTAAEIGARITAVGVIVPGIIDAQTGHVWAPNIPGWDDYPLRDGIRAALSDAAIRVVIDNDRAGYILGEAWQGAAQGCRNAIFLAVGTGIAAGILADGRVIYGSRGIAGSIGWLALDRPFRLEYVSCGCFESHASGSGVTKQFADRRSRTLTTNDSIPLTARDVWAAYERGDKLAEEVLNEAIQYWGMATANLVSLFDPEKIIFGGGMFGPATRFLSDIFEYASYWAQPVSMSRVKFEASQLGVDAGLYGAGHLALFGSRLVGSDAA
jgi:glucokinase